MEKDQENKETPKVFAGSDISSEQKQLNDYIQSKGNTEMPDQDAMSKIHQNTKTLEEVRKLYNTDLDQIGIKMDPNFNRSQNPYSIFSGVLGNDISSFKEKINEGGSLDEVYIQKKAEKSASRIIDDSKVVSSSTIPNIIQQVITLNHLKEMESFDDIDSAINKAGMGSLQELLSFYRESSDATEKSRILDSKLFHEISQKHDLLFNAVGKLLKDEGIKNPNLEGTDKKFEQLIKELGTKTPIKSIESVKNTEKEKTTETIKETTSTEKTQPIFLESIKKEEKPAEEIKSKPIEAKNNEASQNNIKAENDTKGLEGVTNIRSMFNDIFDNMGKPAESALTPSLLNEQKTLTNEVPESKSKTTIDSFVSDPIKNSAPNIITGNNSSASTNTKASSIFGINDSSSKINPKGFTQITPAGLTKIIEKVNNISNISGVGSVAKNIMPGIDSQIKSLSGEVENRISMPKIESLINTNSAVENTRQSVMERSPLKMSKEIPVSNPVINNDTPKDNPIQSTQEESNLEKEKNIIEDSETKKKEEIKNIQSNGNDNVENTNMIELKEMMGSLLSVMNEIHQTLQSPLIVTSSTNKFD